MRNKIKALYQLIFLNVFGKKKKKKKVMNWKRNFILRKWTEIDRMDQVDSCRP